MSKYDPSPRDVKKIADVLEKFFVDRGWNDSWEPVDLAEVLLAPLRSLTIPACDLKSVTSAMSKILGSRTMRSTNEDMAYAVLIGSHRQSQKPEKPVPPFEGDLVKMSSRGRDHGRDGSVMAVGLSQVIVRWYVHGPAFTPDDFCVTPLATFWVRFEKASGGL